MTTQPDALTGRIALVTGASRGIGRAVAVALAQAGADIAINFQHHAGEAEQVRAQVEECGRRCLIVQADVSVAAQVSRMAASVEDALGAVDILVNNAGIARPLPLAEITEADWDQTMDINLKSMFLVTQAVLAGMRAKGWGRIINMSSVAAQIGGIVGPHYAASKAGIIGLTHSYASQLAKEGITANTISPALIETDMIGGNPLAITSRIPVGRFGTCREVAEVVVMLAGNGYITGQTIQVNGGMYLS
jgi:3-oxoacyl-[acyl-carrier protein] reductase